MNPEQDQSFDPSHKEKPTFELPKGASWDYGLLEEPPHHPDSSHDNITTGSTNETDNDTQPTDSEETRSDSPESREDITDAAVDEGTLALTGLRRKITEARKTYAEKRTEHLEKHKNELKSGPPARPVTRVGRIERYMMQRRLDRNGMRGAVNHGLQNIYGRSGTEFGSDNHREVLESEPRTAKEKGLVREALGTYEGNMKRVDKNVAKNNRAFGGNGLEKRLVDWQLERHQKKIDTFEERLEETEEEKRKRKQKEKIRSHD